MSRRMRPSYYGVQITSIVPWGAISRQDFRVYWHGELSGDGNALMRKGVNTERVAVGDVCDVIRNGNGRILALRRPEPEEGAAPPKRKFEVEVLVELELDGDEEAAFAAVDVLMQSAWDRTQGGTTIRAPHWHFSMLEGCVADVTEESR